MDYDFYVIGLFQIGFGKVVWFESYVQDIGCMCVIGDFVDVYVFCMLSLRNVMIIVFYGYNGVYVDLGDMICYYINVEEVFVSYDLVKVYLLSFLGVNDLWVMLVDEIFVIFVVNVFVLSVLFEVDICDLISFLEMFEDFVKCFGVLEVVFSGLLLDQCVILVWVLVDSCCYVFLVLFGQIMCILVVFDLLSLKCFVLSVLLV